jgi:hypothetical protein
MHIVEITQNYAQSTKNICFLEEEIRNIFPKFKFNPLTQSVPQHIKRFFLTVHYQPTYL